jgi:hypothetical protein
LDVLLGFGLTGTGDQEILLDAGLGDLAFQLTKLLLEGGDVLPLGFVLGVEPISGRLFGLFAAQGFLGQIITTVADRQLSLLLPFVRFLLVLLKVIEEPLFRCDSQGDGLLDLDEVVLHVLEQLFDHLLGIFGPIDQVTNIGANDSRNTIPDAHWLTFFRCSPLQPSRL